MITKQKNVTDILSEKKEYVTPQASLTGVDWPVLMLYTSVTIEHTDESWTEQETHDGIGSEIEDGSTNGWF